MTQEKETVRKIAEFNALFLALNDKGQDAALTVLQSLNFAQMVMSPKDTENSKEENGQMKMVI